MSPTLDGLLFKVHQLEAKPQIAAQALNVDTPTC